MQRVFGAPDLRDAVGAFDEGVRAKGQAPLEVAIRWAVYHSALEDGDGVVLGASRTAPVVEAVEFARRGPLTEDLLNKAVYD
ncbi:hypothetical protein F4774DRAFT_405921 [Daldinia eschscholtzii]|nr:hypothetical protein F4774DRAFT_405921 [Daldinia eschscholtzii]